MELEWVAIIILKQPRLGVDATVSGSLFQSGMVQIKMKISCSLIWKIAYGMLF